MRQCHKSLCNHTTIITAQSTVEFFIWSVKWTLALYILNSLPSWFISLLHTLWFSDTVILSKYINANRHTATFIWNRCLLNSLCKWGQFERAKTTLKMLLASWILVCFFKRFRSFNAKNLRSVVQSAAKLSAMKLWEWLDCDRESNPGRLADWGRGWLADFFLGPPTLTASNFAVLWPTYPTLSALKDLNPFKIV